MALLLGEDGRGYELARRLESCGAWRAWLGDAAYAAFAHSLSSAAAWDAFLNPSSSGSRAQLQLQLRARALLFDKASASLFLRPSTVTQISNLNPSYLQLHDDEIYFSLEDEQHDGFQPQTPSKPSYSPHRASQHSFDRASSAGSRYNDPEHVNTSKYEDFPNKCYNQYVERYKIKHQKFPLADKESHKRTSEGMSVYFKLRDLHKRKRQIFKDHPLPMLDTESSMHSKVISEENNSNEEDISFFPEIMFPANCVPESALPVVFTEKKQKVEVYGVLDNLPTVISRSPAMMERFGIRPDYVKMGNKYRGKDGFGGDKRPLSQEQASQMAHKAVARLLISVGFEGGTEISMKVFSDFFSNHINKLGRNLKILTDNYKKQVSSIELLKMFLQISGHGNLGDLTEITKNSNNVGFAQQTQQTVRELQTPQQNPLLQAQQDKRAREIVLKAMGQAISKAVAIVEIIKKRIPGLYQDTTISSSSITDVWEPIEEGLVPLETTRHVSMISITLSTRDLNINSPGYQVPLNVEHLRQQPRHQSRQYQVGQPYHQSRQAHNQYNDDYSYGRGRGRGRGRGFGRSGYGGYDGYGGYGNYEDEGNWNWSQGGGRGRGWNYHGSGYERGRGGRGYGGRGYGRARGRMGGHGRGNLVE